MFGFVMLSFGRGINECYRIEMLDFCWKGNLDMLCVCKTKLSGSGTFNWSRMKCMRSSLQEGTANYAKEGVRLQ